MPAIAPAVNGMGRLQRVVQIAASFGGAVLVVFHGWLLATQIAAGRLTEPGLAFRWLIAATLVAGLLALQRSGASIWSRRGIGIWVLAALLHGPAVAAATDQTGPLALPEAVASAVIQIAVTSGPLALGLWLVGQLVAASHRRAFVRLAPAASVRRRLADPLLRPFSPRPPPRA